MNTEDYDRIYDLKQYMLEQAKGLNNVLTGQTNTTYEELDIMLTICSATVLRMSGTWLKKFLHSDKQKQSDNYNQWLDKLEYVTPDYRESLIATALAYQAKLMYALGYVTCLIQAKEGK